MNHFFVTGATGVVGSSLIPVLLQMPDSRVTLLIRATSDADLADRLETLYRFWKIAPGDVDMRARVRAVAGDTTRPALGMSDGDHDHVRARCTHVIHAAGLVRMNLPLEDARSSALGSMRHVVALARACARLQKLDVVSTVGVGGTLREPVRERWLTEPRAFHNTYEQAKAEAEDFLRAETERSALPLTVHRPSMVVGDSRDGRIISFQVFYFLSEFLSGRRTFGLYPDFGQARVDIIACDLVAGAIAASSIDPAMRGRILHLCSGPRDALRIEELKDRVRVAYGAHGLKVPRARVMTQARYARLARVAARIAPRDLRKALSTLPVYLDYLAGSQAFDDAHYTQWRQSRGLERPAPIDYLDKVLGYYFAQRHA